MTHPEGYAVVIRSIVLFTFLFTSPSAFATCEDNFNHVSPSVAAAMMTERERSLDERITLLETHGRILELTEAEREELEHLRTFRGERLSEHYGDYQITRTAEGGPRAQVVNLGVTKPFSMPDQSLNILLLHGPDEPRAFVLGDLDPRRSFRELDVDTEVFRLGPNEFERALIEALWAPPDRVDLADRRVYSGAYRMPVNLGEQWGVTRSGVAWHRQVTSPDGYLAGIDERNPFVTRRPELEYHLQILFRHAEAPEIARHNRAVSGLGFRAEPGNQGMSLRYTVPRPARLTEYLARLGPAFAHVRFVESERATAGFGGRDGMWHFDFPAALEFATNIARGEITLFSRAPDLEDYSSVIMAFALIPPASHAWLKSAFAALLVRRQDPALRREADRDLMRLGNLAHRLLQTYAHCLFWDDVDHGIYQPELILAQAEIPPERFGAADLPEFDEVMARVARAQAIARDGGNTGARYRRLIQAFEPRDRARIEAFEAEMLDRVRRVRAAAED